MTKATTGSLIVKLIQTYSPDFLHSEPAVVVGIFPDQDVPDTEGEAFRVQEVGEQLGEGALQLS